MDDSVANLIQTYHELNVETIEELDGAPSPLEFLRCVAKNRPFVVREAAMVWPALKKWNASYLAEVMDERQVNVAVTPYG